ncbi:MAG: hypothetical protein ACRDDA_13120 [Aeromonas sp.]
MQGTNTPLGLQAVKGGEPRDEETFLFVSVFPVFPQVALHKTNQVFGPAQLSLTPEEYGWFRRFLGLRDSLVGGANARYMFFTSTPLQKFK